MNIRRIGRDVGLATALLVLLLRPAPAQTSPDRDPSSSVLRPAEALQVTDRRLDAGDALRIRFVRSPDDPAGEGPVESYQLLRRRADDPTFAPVKSFPATLQGDTITYEDGGLRAGREYLYRVRLVTTDGDSIDGAVIGPVRPQRQWFFTNKVNTAISTVVFVLLILGFIRAAQRGRDLFIRRIAGLDAIDEAVGRCTEMGKPTLYIPGISTIADVATIASLNILGQVAKKIAAYQSRILVPNRDPIVYPVTEDVVKLAFTEAGYPQDYRDEDVYFVTNDQFSYAAAVCGTMVRDKPGANLLLGMFYAESLVLAETGASIGAIQIAGTDAITQLPFFVTACDYTIIGEELYAASAYIGREPTLLGSLKGQDYYKLIFIVLITIGIVFATVGEIVRDEPFYWIKEILNVRGSGG
ncbi:MAG: hypothetical protein GF346_10850 [Candidatus Eisenbacteria bacterium]|nr:hypothetical protein [Candidatus Latescibacterota bacterium]MBD3302935.1 hypothetical protein [Candidatus Eisenbacteria bacterium]